MYQKPEITYVELKTEAITGSVPGGSMGTGDPGSNAGGSVIA